MTASDDPTQLPQHNRTGRPLTRRQIREMERARMAAQAVARTDSAPSPADPAPAPSARTGPTVTPAPGTSAESARTPAPRASAASAAPAVVPSVPGAEAEDDSAEPPAVTGAQRAIGATLGRPRPRGRAATVLAILAGLAIVLVPVGVARLYSGGDTGNGGTSVSSGGVLQGDAPLETVMEVAGRVGSVPVVSLYGRLTPVNGLSTDVVIEGDGHELTEGEAILLSVSTFSGDTGTNTTGTETGTRIYRGLLDTSVLGEGLTTAVAGTTEGSRIVLRAPVTNDDGTVSTEITVVDVLPTTAAGDVIAPPENTPVVTAHEDETVTVSVEGLAAPTRSTVAVLIKGSGQQVTGDDVVIARYVIVNWSDGAQQASTYGASVVPVTIDMTDTMAGISQHLVDVTVGSRVVLSLPADQATGEDAIAIVIDVLAIADGGGITDVNATPAAEEDAPVVQVTPNSGE